PAPIAGKAGPGWPGRATESRQSRRGSGDGMHDREIDRNTGSPRDEGVTSTDTPRGAGRVARGSEGALVQDQRKKGQESHEIGDEPTNSTDGSETPGGVARQSEASAELSLLRAVRQGVSSRCAE